MTKFQIPNPKLVIGHWSLVIGLLLLTWGLRLCCLDTVPPGWRDDELINIHALSGELLEGRFPLYFTGASGHEPLYHYLHAGVHAILGFNVLSGHLLSIACGMLTVALTYALARRLFGRSTAVIASLALATSFWSLMYSRTAIRHISLPPIALATFYLFWRALSEKPDFFRKTWFLVGLTMGISLYTYPAARLLPVLLVVFGAYLALFHRDRFSRNWRGLLLALVVAAVLAVPLGVVIAQGSADARLEELAVPLRELRAGNLRPLLESIWTTLGMFHATGDPEWLYNISDRPVFNLLGAALLWTGVALCLYRWRQPRYFFLLLWLGMGLLPAFLSTPPASLGHTILAQPVAYILPALAVGGLGNWGIGKLVNGHQSTNEATPQTDELARTQIHADFRRQKQKNQRGSAFICVQNLVSSVKNFGPQRSSLPRVIGCLLAFFFLTSNAARDLRDYFVVWPQQDMVRFLYRADYREAAHYLDAHPEITDVAISSLLMGPWDRLALEVDLCDDVAVRLFNPERALVWSAGGAPLTVLLTTLPEPVSPIDSLLEGQSDPPEAISSHLTLYAMSPTSNLQPPISNFQFANGLELSEARWLDEGVLLTTWLVAAPLDLPSIPLVANPPPPGVYSGPRLAVFTHLLAADGTFVAGDDGLWVDPLTLRPGDCFIQVHRFIPPPDAPYALELGLYDPMTGERWPVLDSAGQPAGDHILFADVESGRP